MINMPVPPLDTHPDFIYFQAFTRVMSDTQQHEDIALRILSAIEQSANRTETSPAHLARLLVSYGLRAPRHAFPESFSNYAETYIRTLNDNPSLSMAQHHDIIELHQMWENAATQASGKKTATA